METKDRFSEFVELGLHLGYPKCCVDNFADECSDLSRIINRPIRKLTGTGFIPCQVCSDTYTDDELIETITQNRSSELPPFPHY